MARRYIRKKDVLAVHVGGLEVARVVGMGTISPELQSRGRGGRWTWASTIDDRYARSYLREYAELAEWILKRKAL